MSGYIGPIPVPQGIQNKESFTATAGQTTFNTNGYTDGAFINVFLNGVRLVNGTDYTATNGSDVVLASGANAGDVLDFETFNSFSLVDQTFDNVTLKNPTHEDTDGGRESAVSFKGEQSGGEISTLAQIQGSHDGTSDDQKGDLIFKTNDGSDNDAPTERLRIDSAGSIITATLGVNNTHLGEGAGAAIVSGGNNNVLVGYQAGNAITTGDKNTAIGVGALDVNTTASFNTALGYNSLGANTTGVHNTALGSEGQDGRSVLHSNTTGGYNVAVGNQALSTNTTGNYNTAIGYQCLNLATTADNNTSVGLNSMYNTTTGHSNVAVGNNTLDSNTTGSYLTAVGRDALGANTTGNYNTAVGQIAGDAITTASYNTAIGRGALTSNVTGDSNTAIGYAAGEACTGAQNVFVGTNAGDAQTNAADNTAVGYDALTTNVGTQNNVAVGTRALRDLNNSSGNTHNTAVGSNAGRENTVGLQNTYLGGNAGYYTSTNSYTTFVGMGAGFGTSGSNLTGNFNTAVGYEAGFKLITSAEKNTFLGAYAGYYNGTNSTSNGITTGTNVTAVGFAAYPSSATASNEFTLGNSSVGNLRCNDTSISSLSDERDKTNIVDVPLGLDFIKTLRPVAFDWDRRDGTKQGLKDFGFIAQELKTAQDATDYADHMRLVHTGTVLVPDAENTNPTEDEDGNPIRDVSGTMQECLEADPMKTYPVLVKAVQELSTALDAALARIATLEAE